MVIFEPDWLPEDKKAVEDVLKTPVFWHKVIQSDCVVPNRQLLRATKNMSFQISSQVTMNNDTLPSYYENQEAIFTYLKKHHPNGDVSLNLALALALARVCAYMNASSLMSPQVSIPNPMFHGFGYRLMCRFFAGLIFHAPGDQTLSDFHEAEFLTITEPQHLSAPHRNHRFGCSISTY